MHTKMRNLAIAVLSIVGGSAVGYFLWEPVLELPLERSLEVLWPFLSWVDGVFHNLGAWYVAQALALFLVGLPNTLALTLIAVLSLRAMVFRRLAFYSVFLYPLLIHAFYWFEVWRLKHGAQQRGLPSSIEQLPTNVHAGTYSVLILLTYGLFSLIVVAVNIQANVRRQRV